MPSSTARRLAALLVIIVAALNASGNRDAASSVSAPSNTTVSLNADENLVHTTSRRLGSKSRSALAYPDFFVIGAMKCATSSLNALLITHPEICAEGDKEKHFFDTDDYLSKDGLANYLKEFKNCKNLYTIDSTPRYIQEEVVPGRLVSSYAPSDLRKKRFVLTLREPTARQYSEYQDMVRICLEHGGIEGYRQDDKKDSTFQRSRGALKCPLVSKNYNPKGMALADLQLLTFAEWLASDYGQMEVSRGYYRQHLAHWTAAGIARSQIFVVNFQTLTQNTSDTMARLGAFFGLKSSWGPAAALPESKQRKPPTVMDCATYDKLNAHYAQVNANLYSFINNARDRPPSEPYFPVFDSSRSKCVNVPAASSSAAAAAADDEAATASEEEEEAPAS